jgi:hypothetical protein
MRLPSIVAHADWGTEPRKRWLASARVRNDGRYEVFAVRPVGETASLLSRTRQHAEGGLLFGFDFPIGLPRTYAERAGISSFIDFLRELDHGDWPDFFRVAEAAEGISLRRPFYPQRPGGALRQHLLEGLGVGSMDDIRRRCELQQPWRPAACPLFWTLGGQQVGKAAISGWREVILPALREEAIDAAVWPFDGPLEELLSTRSIVLCETYPADAYSYLGVDLAVPGTRKRASKRDQVTRARQATPLLAWAKQARVDLSADLATEIHDGFGGGRDGEDRFDAVVGLFGMLEVVAGRRPAGNPSTPEAAEIEGWILGQLDDCPFCACFGPS